MAIAKQSSVKKAAKKAATKAPAKKRAAKTTAQSLVDDQLARYRSMRDFAITSEPSGSGAKIRSKEWPFVIQKHAASHLHYDFRLGWNGVLKSWAVAKGPSYFPGDRRLAVQVEDHPMEYGGFEGIIPKGQYGGGTVMLWDQGTWTPHVDVDEGLKNGSLKFELHGTKMKGNWTLVRMHNMSGDKPNWLLIKEHDALERGKNDPCITVQEPNSVVTGRSLEEITAAETHIWQSTKTNQPGQPWHHGDHKPASVEAAAITLPSSAKKEPLPDFIPPQLATHVATPPTQGEWLHEIKLDGYRVQTRKQGSHVKLFTRSGLDWTHRMKAIATAVSRLPVQDCILDGEVVVLDPDGNTSFAKLQASFEHGDKHSLHYFVFDLLHLNGANTRTLPLIQRKGLLAKLIPAEDDTLQLNTHITQDGEAVFERACQMHAEGIISKRADSAYTGGRNANWLKLKCVREQEFVIGGFTLPRNGTYGIGALLLGYYQDGKLIYAGRTGTGFNQRTHKLIRDKLEGLRQKAVPFASIPREASRDAFWVKPSLVAQVHFATWTAENLVRQAAFLGLREDKAAIDVTREAPTTAPKPKAQRTTAHRRSESEATMSKPMPNIRLTHPEKILDQETKLTKQQLADYYWTVADRMLPHIADRPLSLVRCPEGSGKPCFFQKHVNHMLPPGVGSVEVPDRKTGKTEPYITLNTAEALAGLAQMGVLEVHPWGSKNEDLEHPDRIILDLDPDPAITWQQLSKSAKEVHDLLQSIRLKSFLKTTGGKGLHIVIPIAQQYTWDTVKTWTRTFAAEMERAQPGLYLIKMSKAARKGKIFIDYLRNERGATAVAPFSPRARAGANVSIPLAWKELDADDLPVFSVQDLPSWKHRLNSDPWKGIATLKQKLPGAEQTTQAA